MENKKDIIVLYVCALRWRKLEEECNPDVGMGPSIITLLEGLIEETKVKLTKKEKNMVIEIYEIKYKKNQS